MKKSLRIVSLIILFACSIIYVSAQTQKQTYVINDRRVGVILQRLERSSTRFRSSLNLTLIRVRIDQTRTENDINTFEPDLEQAINEFKDRFAGHLANPADVQNVLQKASLINSFMTRNRLSQSVQTEWASVRNDLNALATAYGVSWRWNRQLPRVVNSPRLTRLSEPDLDQLIRRIEVGVDAFSASIGAAFDQSRYDRKRSEGTMNDAVVSFKTATDQLRNRFDARQLVIRDVVSLLQKATPLDQFMSDNRVTDRAQRDWSTLRGELGTLAGAYEVEPNWGSSLGQRNVHNGSGPILGNTQPDDGDLILRDGEIVVAVLNNDLTTKQAKQGDRFTMTVRKPAQYEGAVIEGTVGSVNEGGRLTGRSGMSLNFDTIQLRNGQSYRFEGMLTTVRTTNGDTIKVDNEGSAQGDNQTKATVQRATIGTAVGAIIGAIAGGGKGAAIGAIIGAAGGAGSVYVQGKDDLELPRGTELTIRSSGPR